MLNKQIKFDSAARASIKNGMDTLADAVKTTLGPQGRCVVIGNWNNGKPHITKDGVTVAKAIKLSDQFEDLGCQLIREAALKSVNVCGDGTTTSIVLSQAFCDELEVYLAGDHDININDFRRGMVAAKQDVLNYLNKTAIPVKGKEDLLKIATISANGDECIGRLIADAFEKVTADGVISVDFSKNTNTTIEIIPGMQFERGYLAPHFITDEAKGQCVLEKPYVLISDQKILRTKDIIPVLEPIASSGGSILLIAEDFDDEVLENLKLNKLQNILKVCAVKAPSFGDYRKEIIQDLAILTDGEPITYDSSREIYDVRMEHLGRAERVIVTKDDCLIIGGAGNKTNIAARVDVIKSQLDSLEKIDDPNDFTVKFLKSRIAKLIGGVAVIHVGGTTELEMNERKDRIDDAICACRAALEEGVIIGGGMSFFSVPFKKLTKMDSYECGYSVISVCRDVILEQIMENAGYTINDFEIHPSRKIGFNAKTCKISNLLKEGIINPVKCDRVAFENAFSIAELFLSINCAITDEVVDHIVTM